jgi:hypothetical protein
MLANRHAPVSNPLVENQWCSHQRNEERKGTVVRSDFRSPLPSITPNVVEIGRKPDFDEGKIGAKDQSLKRCC